MLLRLHNFILFTTLVYYVSCQSSCGREAIPYLISVDLTGKPEISCDTPACFGPLKSPLINEFDSNSNEIGVLQRTAVCSGKFTNAPCSANDEWTGGVAELNNGTHISLTMECCRFEGLNYATEHKIAMIRPGERYVGGPVKENGRLIAFDLVKEVRKNVNPNNEIHYIAHIYRMSCVPAPSRLTNRVDPTMTTGEYLARRLSAKSRPPNKYEPRVNRYRNYNNYEYEYYYDRPAFKRRNNYRRTHGRRRFRPVDEYEYYEYDPKMTRRRPINKHTDVLWPINDDRKSNDSARAHASKNFDTSYSVHNEYPTNDANAVEELPKIYGTDENSNTVTFPPQQDFSHGSIVLPAPSQDTYAIAVQSSPTYVAPVSSSGYALYPTQYQQSQSYNQYPQQTYQQSSSYDQSQQTYSAGCESTTTGCSTGCASTGCMNGMFSSLQCFSEDMLVETPAGKKSMKELEIGDLVMSMDGSLMTYSKVVMFLHRKEEEDAYYIHIKTEQGNDLKITSYHLMYKTNCKVGDRLRLVKAEDVMVGDCIHLNSNSRLKASRVLSLDIVHTTGIYAPLTASGDMFVNGVLVSCHSNLAAQTLQQTFFAWWRQWAGLVARISHFILPKRYSQHLDGDLPFGVEYLTTVVDLFIPQTLFSQ